MLEIEEPFPRSDPVMALVNATPLLCLFVLCMSFTAWSRDARERQVLAHEGEMVCEENGRFIFLFV